MRTWSRLLSALHRRDRIASDLEEEMQLHRELRARQLRESGVRASAAGERASRLFGHQSFWKEEALSMWRWNWVEDFLMDVRFALRWMRTKPLFTAVIVLTLALGIGANTAMFSLANALLLRTLPVRDAAQLVYVHIEPEMPDGASNTGNGISSFSYDVYRELRGQRQAFEDLVAYVPLGLNKIPIRAGTVPEEAAVDMVSGDFFSALGVTLTCGAGFHQADEEAANSVAVIGEGLWNRSYGGTCDALGKTVFIKGIPFTVVGVAPGNFRGVEGSSASDVWIPLQRRPELNAWGSPGDLYQKSAKWWCLRLMARLPAGMNGRRAAMSAQQSMLTAAYRPLGGRPHPGEQPRHLDLVAARGLGQPELNKPLAILVGMVALVLLIACLNVAMLLVSRNATRQREIGIRLALGGGQGRLLRQFLAESLLLVSAGATLGYGLAFGATKLLARWAEIDAPVTPDGTVLLWTMLLSAAIALGFGLAPFFTTPRSSLAPQMMQGSQASAFTSRARTHSRLAVLTMQVALGLVLMVSAGLFTRSLRKLEGRKLGMAAEKLLVFGIEAPASANTGAKNTLFFQDLLERIRQIPGVEAATTLENRPGTGWSNNTNAYVDGRSDVKTASGAPNMMRWNGVGPAFFSTFGIGVRQGRDFTASDTSAAPKVAVVNQTFAREFFAGRSALGHSVSFGSKDEFAIVGVAADSVYTSLQEERMPMVWFPLAQIDDIARHVAVRTSRNPDQMFAQIRRHLAAFYPDLAMLQPKTQAAEFASTASAERLIARLALFFGAMAMLLVATGLYGTLAYRVNRRTAELGIRMAIGAQQGQILWLVLRESLLVLALGAVLGLPLSIATGRWLASLLYQLTPYDATSFAIALAAITAVTLAASLLPARRAARIDPVTALRHE